MSEQPALEAVSIEAKVRAMTVDLQMGAAAIAAELKVSERTVQRYRRRVGVSQQRARQATPEEAAWIKKARAEGMPATWIAETVNLKRDAVQRRGRMPEGARTEWMRAWADIRRNPTLLALHREFAGEGQVAEEEAA